MFFVTMFSYTMKPVLNKANISLDKPTIYICLSYYIFLHSFVHRICISSVKSGHSVADGQRVRSPDTGFTAWLLSHLKKCSHFFYIPRKCCTKQCWKRIHFRTLILEIMHCARNLQISHYRHQTWFSWIGHFLYCKYPHFQNEVKCTIFLVKMSFICMRMNNHFHIKSSALNHLLMERVGGTQKWPILLNNTKLKSLG